MKKSFVLKIALISCVVFVFSGCDILDKLMGKTTTTKQGAQTPISSSEEDEKAKNLIKDFYAKIYAEPIDVSYKNNVEGNVLDKVAGNISKDTITSKEKTPELPIHYPRFVEINGMTIVGYEVLKKDKNPEINARYYEDKSENTAQPNDKQPNDKQDKKDDKDGEKKGYYAYYVDVNLLATVVKNEEFNTYFRYNNQTKLIDKLMDIPKDKADTIKIKARYDVLLQRSVSGEYKIESAIEATAKQNFYRLNKINNDFITRLTYFNVEDPKDKKEYDAETSLLNDYFRKVMLNTDKEKYSILTNKWNSSPEEFSAYLETLKLLKNDKGQEYLNNLLDKATYKNRFDLKAFPIKPGIEKVKSCEITINEHPSFTEKQRNYRVLVLANVDKNEGKISSDSQYIYEITASVTTVGDKLAINSFKLNQFNMKREIPEEKK